jgi:CheY-like chemotaxis protein
VTSSLLPRILVIDDDRDLGEVVTAVLGDEGYQVTVLEHISDESVRAAIGSLEPDCILLDGVEAAEYAEAWATAAEVRHRERPIPTVMFTAHRFDAEEAIQGTSPSGCRSRVQRGGAQTVPHRRSDRHRTSRCGIRGALQPFAACRAGPHR